MSRDQEEMVDLEAQTQKADHNDDDDPGLGGGTTTATTAVTSCIFNNCSNPITLKVCRTSDSKILIHLKRWLRIVLLDLIGTDSLSDTIAKIKKEGRKIVRGLVDRSGMHVLREATMNQIMSSVNQR